jgi:HK97 family phage portal protein
MPPDRLLPTDWRRDPVAAGIALAAATATLDARSVGVETAALPAGSAQQKLYYTGDVGSLLTWNMVGYTGPLVHGPGAWRLYAPYGGMPSPPIASNSAVFACLSVIAKSYWEAPLRVFRKDADGEEKWLDDHPFQELVDDPHEWLTKPEVEWWYLVALHVHGNAYLRKVRSGAEMPRHLQLLSPTKVRPVTTKEDRARGVFVSHYAHEYEPSKYEEIPAEDIVHFRMGVDDADHRLGCSPLQRVIREVASDDEASAFTESLLKNVGTAGLVVQLPQGVPMTEQQAQELKGRIEEAFTGGNRGRVGVLTNGATLSNTGFSPQAMNLKDIHRIPEERVAAVLGVHPMVAGLGAGLERSTFSNYEEAREALFEQTIIPLYVLTSAVWQKHVLRPDFDTDRAVSCRYDTNDVRALQPDMNEVYERLSVAVEKKWITRNEARSEVGLPPVDGWDEEDTQPAVDAAAALAEATAPALPPPGDDDDDEEEESAPTSASERRRERRARAAATQRKARGLEAIPGLLDVVHDLATPALARDLGEYYAGQRARVLSRLRKQGG